MTNMRSRAGTVDIGGWAVCQSGTDLINHLVQVVDNGLNRKAECLNAEFFR